MRTYCLVICSALAICPSPAFAQDDTRPNIVFFLVDDQRNTTLGVAGDPHALTPTIDRLAKEGVYFTNAFVTTSICAASRASIFTGLTERTHGYTFGQPPISEALVQESYPSLLKEAGYTTAFFGKFGVKISGKADEVWFDAFGNRDRPYLKKQPDGSVRHVDEINTDQAVGFLSEYEDEKPFCLSISFSSTHAEDSDKENHFPPIEEAKELFPEVTYPEPRLSDPAIFENHPEFLKASINRDRYFWRWDTPEKYQKNMRDYYRLLAGVDIMIARVLSALEKAGQADNTVIIYAADNGYYMGDRGFAGKWSHYEESLRVPLIVCDPRAPKKHRGQIVDAMTLNLDLPATMLDLAGVTAPERYQGRSLTPWLNGKTPVDWRTDIFVEHRWERHDIPKWEGVRDERYVYARYDGQSPPYEFLHDLQADPDQLENFVEEPEYASQLARLWKRTDALRDEYLAAIPDP